MQACRLRRAADSLIAAASVSAAVPAAAPIARSRLNRKAGSDLDGPPPCTLERVGAGATAPALSPGTHPGAPIVSRAAGPMSPWASGRSTPAVLWPGSTRKGGMLPPHAPTTGAVCVGRVRRVSTAAPGASAPSSPVGNAEGTRTEPARRKGVPQKKARVNPQHRSAAAKKTGGRAGQARAAGGGEPKQTKQPGQRAPRPLPPRATTVNEKRGVTIKRLLREDRIYAAVQELERSLHMAKRGRTPPTLDQFHTVLEVRWCWGGGMGWGGRIGSHQYRNEPRPLPV